MGGVRQELYLTLLMQQVLFFGLYGLGLHWAGEVPPQAYLFFGLSPVLPLACVIWVHGMGEVLSRPDGSPLESLGLANHLTLFRLGSLPALAFLMGISRMRPAVLPLLVIWAALAFLTDFLDGFLSRHLGQVSRFGQALDSTSDYLLLLSLLFVFLSQNLLPWWLGTLALVRLGLQMIGMMILMFRRRSLILETTWMGKVAVFTLMVVLLAHLITYWGLKLEEGWASALAALDGLAALVLVVSMVDKAVYFLRRWRS